MSDQHTPDILGSLPRTRPHRRSDKRTASQPAEQGSSKQPAARKPTPPRKPTPHRKPKPPREPTPPREPRASGKAAAAPARPRRNEPLRQPKQPAGNPPAPRNRRPVPSSGAELVGTMVQAAAELAEIGLSVSARAVRNAVARLPRP